MKVQLESTTKIVELNGVPARVWQGRTESGIEVTALITRISVDRSDDTSQFEAELASCVPPRIHVDAWPARLVL